MLKCIASDTLVSMKAAELEKFMKENDVSAVDIASALKMHPVTIERFLKGESARRSTKAAFERFMSSFSKKQQHSGGVKSPGS